MGTLALLASTLALAAPSSPPEGRISMVQYVTFLENVLTLLEEGRTEEARGWAQNLRGAEVAFAGESFTADPTVLDAIQGAKTATEARRQTARVRRLVSALRAVDGTASPPAEVAPQELESLRPKEEAEKGGAVGRFEVEPPSVAAQIGEALLAAYDWVAAQIRRVLDWLDKLRPRRKADRGGLGGTTAAAIAVVAAAVCLLAGLAWRTLRRGTPAPVEVESDPILGSAKDEDPLSRETLEWEARARELAVAGRFREAIRAWYHAVLVALFRAGRLLHQKGRTNWEYVAQAAPEAAWRAPLAGLTEVFDREWYGREASAPEALRECAARAREVLRSVRGEATP
jgi:hypothetical protein